MSHLKQHPQKPSTEPAPGHYLDLHGVVHVVHDIAHMDTSAEAVVIHKNGLNPNSMLTPVSIFMSEVSIYDPHSGDVTKMPRYRKINTDASYFEVEVNE